MNDSLNERSPTPAVSLQYASPKLSIPESPFPHISFWCGILALSLGSLVLPTEVFGYHRPVPRPDERPFLLLLCGQCLLAGAGIAVAVMEVARRWKMPRQNKRLFVAILCNLVAVLVVACEIARFAHAPPEPITSRAATI